MLRCLSRWLMPAVCLILLAGCDREEIKSYTVKKPAAPVVEEKVRLLAAVLEDGKDQWYFKLLGPVDEVAGQAEPFARFVESVRFTGKADKPVEWAVPTTWEKGAAGGKLRHATFYPDPKNKGLELAVFHFDQVSSLLENVNRWCKLDLGRRPLREGELKDVSKKFKAGKNEGVLVDMKGPGAKKGAHPPMGGGMGGNQPPPGDGGKAAPASKEFLYKTPEGWADLGPRPGFVPVLRAFGVGKTAELKVTVLGASFGDPLGNINRWRAEVGLPAVSTPEPKPTNIKVGKSPAEFYDLTGPAGSARKRSLLVLVKRGQQTWFFKLVGDAETVGANRAKFDSFIQSIQFTGAADE